jgi:hypothetical protein
MLKVAGDENANHSQHLLDKKKAICKQMMDKNLFLQRMGLNKLMHEHQIKKAQVKDKMKFIIKTLIDKDSSDKFRAYNSIRENWQIQKENLHKDEIIKSRKKKIIKLLTDSSFM